MFTTSDIAAFAKGLRGQLLRPGDDTFDEARTARLDRRPPGIMRRDRDDYAGAIRIFLERSERVLDDSRRAERRVLLWQGR